MAMTQRAYPSAKEEVKFLTGTPLFAQMVWAHLSSSPMTGSPAWAAMDSSASKTEASSSASPLTLSISTSSRDALTKLGICQSLITLHRNCKVSSWSPSTMSLGFRSSRPNLDNTPFRLTPSLFTSAKTLSVFAILAALALEETLAPATRPSLLLLM